MTSSESSGEKQTAPKKRGRGVSKKPAGQTRDDEETDTEMPLHEHEPLGQGDDNDDEPDDGDGSTAVDPAIPEDLRGGMPLIKRPAGKIQKKTCNKAIKEEYFRVFRGHVPKNWIDYYTLSEVCQMTYNIEYNLQPVKNRFGTWDPFYFSSFAGLGGAPGFWV